MYERKQETNQRGWWTWNRRIPNKLHVFPGKHTRSIWERHWNGRNLSHSHGKWVQGATVTWEKRSQLAFMKLENWVFVFCLLSRSGPNTKENILEIRIIEMEKRECLGLVVVEGGWVESETKFRILHISEHYTEQQKFCEVRKASLNYTHFWSSAKVISHQNEQQKCMKVKSPTYYHKNKGHKTTKNSSQ